MYMATLNRALLMSAGFAVLFTASATAQTVPPSCGLPSIVPSGNSEQPPARIVIEPPLAEPLASRGVVILQYCVENLHIVPVFGPNAAGLSPRIGHLHVAVDDLAWVWADASGNPIILQGLPAGPHKVRLDLVDAAHHPIDKQTISFVVPKTRAAEQHQ
jgi:hypothetical protein